MNLATDLQKHGSIRIAVIGCGLMGSGLVGQLNRMDHMEVVLWASRTEETLRDKARALGLAERADFAESLKEARALFEKDAMILSTNNALAWELDEVDVIVDCTGNTEAGCEINRSGLERGKHIVSFNVECDVLLGPYFDQMARERGLTYTGTAGDEPGAIMELYDFASFLGFEVVAAGKGKNNPMDVEATPEKLAEEAEKKGLSPRMLTSFVDATNTMIELNAVSNATGLMPDVAGCHGIKSGIDELADQFKTVDEGGFMEGEGILDFVQGIAPGVFVVIKTDDPVIEREMPYLSMGEGPRYVLYRPYHLTNIETPITIARAILYGEATIRPSRGYCAHTVAVAKRDLVRGERIQGIGSDSSYGKLVEAETCYGEGLLPIGLITGDVVMRRDVKKGDYIHYNDVQLDGDTQLVTLFEKEHEKFYPLPISTPVI